MAEKVDPNIAFFRKVKKAQAVKAACRWLPGVMRSSYTLTMQQGKLTKDDCKTYSIYSKVVSSINNALREAFIEGNDITFPCGMGRIYLGKYEHKPKLINGVVIYFPFIDWNATKNLWAEDEEARKNKVLIRFTNTILYKICYENTKPFRNSWCFRFCPCVKLKKGIVYKAKAGEINI